MLLLLLSQQRKLKRDKKLRSEVNANLSSIENSKLSGFFLLFTCFLVKNIKLVSSWKEGGWLLEHSNTQWIQFPGRLTVVLFHYAFLNRSITHIFLFNIELSERIRSVFFFHGCTVQLIFKLNLYWERRLIFLISLGLIFSNIRKFEARKFSFIQFYSEEFTQLQSRLHIKSKQIEEGYNEI